mmetsp:Transcript_2362/g.6881  ORF Transcript_2362/g.6881 Transcript_2362/m.6881 type:complete len:215 (-) Transcript_2362:279-923(-)
MAMTPSASAVVVVRKALMVPLGLLVLSCFAGVFVHSHLRIRAARKRLQERNSVVKATNAQLETEGAELRGLLSQAAAAVGVVSSSSPALTSGGSLSAAERFTTNAQLIYDSLQARTELLASKEIELWKKEQELEEQREALNMLTNEETEMAGYISLLASRLLDSNLTLPKGLEDRPYLALDLAKRIRGGRSSSKGPLFSFMQQRSPLPLARYVA